MCAWSVLLATKDSNPADVADTGDAHGPGDGNGQRNAHPPGAQTLSGIPGSLALESRRCALGGWQRGVGHPLMRQRKRL